MNIKTIENLIRYGGRDIVSILGPTFAKCSDGSMIMTASVSNGSDSGVGNMQWRSYDEGEHWTEEGFVERSFQCDHLGSMKSGNLIEPSGFHFFECGALRAAWNAGTLSYSWTFGDYVSVIPRQQHYNAEKGIYTTDYSNHGIYEDSKHRLIVYAPYRDENGCSLNRYEITI